MTGISVLGLITIFLLQIAGSFGFPGGSLTLIAFASSITNLSSLLVFTIVVFIAAALGDIAAYEVAKFFSEEFRWKLRKFSFFKDNEEKARKLLKEHEFSIVFWTRWLFFALCAVVSYVAGFEEIDRKKYIFAVLIGEFLYALVHSLAGYFLGEVINNLISTVTDFTLLLASLVVVVYLINYMRKKRKIRF